MSLWREAMGLNLYLEKPPCKHCGVVQTSFDDNHTYNNAWIWSMIYPNDKNMIDIDGMTGEEAYQKLLFAQNYMKKNKENIIKVEPQNLTGSYNKFLEFINKCMLACLEHPDYLWKSSR